jgi:C1A family cysteine protease
MDKRKIKTYGWRPDVPDFRDYKFAAPPIKLALPDQVDLRLKCPPVYDQLDLGSCTANAIGSLGHFLLMKEGKKSFIPSRLFIYWNERFIEGSVNDDAGAEIRTGMKVVSTLGCPHESLWWYNISKFKVKPNKNVFTDGTSHKFGEYRRLDNRNLDDLRACLASGFPFVFGFAVYESFESDQVSNTGVVPMPGGHEAMLGGHAVKAVGYDHPSRRFIVKNSWGPEWGMKGYFTIPYDYVVSTDFADDFWTSTSIL